MTPRFWIPLRAAALVIGVNNGLRFAENDACDIAGLFGSGAGPFGVGGAQLLIGTQATVRSVDVALGRLARQRPDIVIVYFAGHGDTSGMLLGRFEKYAYGRLLGRLRAIGAARQLVILDACQSGAFAEMVKGTHIGGFSGVVPIRDPNWLRAYLEASPGLRVIAATRPYEYAGEQSGADARNGLFTGSFVKHAREAYGDLAVGTTTFVSDLALTAHIAVDMIEQGRPQIPVWVGGERPIPVVRSERDTVLGRAELVSVRPSGSQLHVEFDTYGRRRLETFLLATVSSPLTCVTHNYNLLFVPGAAASVHRAVLEAGAMTSDPWHRASARQGFALDWRVTVADRWGRTLASCEQSVAYRAA